MAVTETKIVLRTQPAGVLRGPDGQLLNSNEILASEFASHSWCDTKTHTEVAAKHTKKSTHGRIPAVSLISSSISPRCEDWPGF